MTRKQFFKRGWQEATFIDMLYEAIHYLEVGVPFEWVRTSLINTVGYSNAIGYHQGEIDRVGILELIREYFKVLLPDDYEEDERDFINLI